MNVQEFIASVTGTKDRITASEIATALVEWLLEEWEIDRPLYDDSAGKPVLWRGATQYARDAMKAMRVAIVTDDEQGELFGETFGEFVWIGGEESTYVRRRALTREEYDRGLALLEEHAKRVADKIQRYRADYMRAVPHWAPGLTFGEAIRRATEAR